MAITTRTLGRTGADVTILGYGAMELRGQPRGPDDRRRRRGPPAERGARRRHQPDRHLDRLRPQRGADRRLHRATAATSSSSLPSAAARSSSRPTRRRPSRTTTAPRTSVPASSRACGACAPITSTCSGAHVAEPRAARGRTTRSRRCGAPRRGQGPFPRHVRHPAEPARPHRDGRLRRLPDPVLGGPARARGTHHRGRRGRRGCLHPRRRGAGRAVGGQELDGQAARAGLGAGGGSWRRPASTELLDAHEPPWSSSCASR